MFERFEKLPRTIRLGLQLLVPVVLLCYGLWSFPLALFGLEHDRIPGDMGDARFNNYILEHFHAYSSGKVDSYWDAPFMYPYKNVIALSDNLLGTAPFYSFFRRAGLGRETSFQLWVLLLFALNYCCCYVALWAWSKRALLSAGGAYIFAFGIHMIGHNEHAQVFPKFMIPIGFYFCWKLLQSGKPLHFALLALAIVYQFYCGIYLGFILCYGLLFLLVAYTIFSYRTIWANRPRTWQPYVILFTIALASGLLLYPLIAPYIAISTTTGMREFSEVINTIPRPRSYFFTHPAALNWRSLSEHSAYAFDEWWSHFHFMGAVPWVAILLLPVIIWINRKDPAKWKPLAIIGLAFILSIVFCLRIGNFTLYRWVFELPGFSAMRAIDRIIHVQAMYFALVTVVVFATLSSKNLVRISIGILLPFVILLENKIEINHLHSFNKYEAKNLVDAVVQSMKAQYDSSTAALAYMPYRGVLPFEKDHLRTINIHLTAMLAGQELGMPVVNAYTGGYPGNYIKFWDSMDPVTLKAWLDQNARNPDGIKTLSNVRFPVIECDTVHIRGSNGLFISVTDEQGLKVLCAQEKADNRETFLRIKLEDGRCAFLAHNDAFLSAALHQDSSLIATGHLLGEMGLFNPIQHDQRTTLVAANNAALVLDNSTNKIFARSDSIQAGAWFNILRVGQ